MNQQATTQAPLFPRPQPQLQTVAVADIAPWNATGRNAVMKSVEELGMVTAIHVEELPAGSQHKYRVIDGRRRLDAAQKNGVTHVPAIVLPQGGGLAYDALAATANLARAYSPLDEAKHLAALVQRGGFTPEDLAKRFGISTATIQARLRLLDLPEEVIQAVEAKRVSLGVADAVSKLTPDQKRAAAKVLRDKGTVTQEDVTSIRRADQQQALEAVTALLEPPPPPDPRHTFQMAARRALADGLTIDELYTALEDIEKERADA